jgi:hypothetical protein
MDKVQAKKKSEEKLYFPGEDRFYTKAGAGRLGHGIFENYKVLHP